MEIRSPPHWMMPRAWCGGRGVSRPRGPDRALLAYRAGAPSLPGLVLCGQLWGERCWGEEGSRCPPSGEDGSLRHRQQVRVLSRKVRKLCRRGDSLLLRGERSGKIGRRRGAGTRSGAAGPDCSTPCPPRTCGSQRGRLARSLPGLPCLSPSPRPSRPPLHHRAGAFWLRTGGYSVLSRITCASCTATPCPLATPHRTPA